MQRNPFVRPLVLAALLASCGTPAGEDEPSSQGAGAAGGGVSDRDDEGGDTNAPLTGGAMNGGGRPGDAAGGRGGATTPVPDDEGDGGTTSPATGGGGGSRPSPATGGAGGTGGGTPPASGGQVGSNAGECDKTIDGAKGPVPVCCTPAAGDQALLDEVFKLLNEYRASKGLAALVRDAKLEQAMQGHCKHMAESNFFSHTAPEAEIARFSDRARLCGSRASGENIAFNQRTAAEVMNTWRNSSGHNQNMLSARWKRVGLGHYQRRWGQIFGE